CSNNTQARYSGDVRNDMVKLYVHLHESLLHVLYMRDRILDHPLSMTQVRSQLSDAGARSKASSKQTVLVELLQPLRVVDVALSPTYVPHMSCAHKNDIKAMSPENLEDGYPVHTRGFHCDGLDSQSHEPVSHMM